MRALLALAITTAAAHADLYAVAGWFGDISYYRLSTLDASTTHLCDAYSRNGVVDLCLASDGKLYAETLYSLEQLDPTTGEAKYVEPVDGPCLGFGPLAAGDGVIYIGVGGPQCPGGFKVWDIESKTITAWLWVDECLFSTFAAVRDDGQIITMFEGDPGVYTVDPVVGGFTRIGSLPEGTIFESAARDPATNVTYVVGSLAGDSWSLYTMDLHTLELDRIGAVPSDIVSIGAMPPCRADFNADGALTILDFIAFQLAWQAGDPRADVNADGSFDVLDFVAFLGIFQKGCS